MKVNQDPKIQKGLKFIQEIKVNPRCIPFLQHVELQRLGLLDFRFVNRKTTNLSIIEQKIKENKYQDLEELVSELKLNFEMIGYYVPLNDPLQADVKYFINEIDKWKSQPETSIIAQQPQQLRSTQKPKPTEPKQSFNRNIKHYESQRRKKEQNYATLEQEQIKMNQTTKAYKQPVRSTLAQKLQMIYFLKANQTNEPFIHMIGDMYGIGKESQDEYVIKLDNSTCCSWLEVLQNNQQNQ